MKTLDLILCMAVGYGYVLFGLSAVAWLADDIFDFFGKDINNAYLYRVRCRTYHRRDRLMYRLRMSRIGKKRGLK